jgi:hypothetical protein
MSLISVIISVLASPFVIGCAVFVVAYGSLLAVVAKPGKEPGTAMPKPIRVKKIKLPKLEKKQAALAKNENTEDLGLE